MANNRVYVRCGGCGEEKYLAKCLSMGYCRVEQSSIDGIVMEFLNEHFHCGPVGDCLKTGHGTAVDLVFEHHHDTNREVSNG